MTKKIKLIDKPLTERQLKFANLYALDAGIKSNTDIAIEAGYPRSSAYQRAYELLSFEHCPHVVTYIRKIQKDIDKKYDVTHDNHLKKLYELRELAANKGMLGVALRSEELRGKAKGLYVDYSKTMNVDINSPEFKEYVEMKHMSEKQIDQKLKDIEDEANLIIAAQEKEVEVDEDSQG